MKILLIGNGFDLAHKLPTTYKDFLLFVEIMKQIVNVNDKNDIIVLIGKMLTLKYIDLYRATWEIRKIIFVHKLILGKN